MKSRIDLRLDCLRLAQGMCMAKEIKAANVVPTAMEFFKWVDDDPGEPVNADRLVERFRVTR